MAIKLKIGPPEVNGHGCSPQKSDEGFNLVGAAKNIREAHLIGLDTILVALLAVNDDGVGATNVWVVEIHRGSLHSRPM